MARGWESKSVEEQKEAAAAPVSDGKQLTPEQKAKRRQAETLRLSRAQVQQQLAAASDPRYQEMLRATLLDLDRQIARSAS